MTRRGGIDLRVTMRNHMLKFLLRLARGLLSRGIMTTREARTMAHDDRYQVWDVQGQHQWGDYDDEVEAQEEARARQEEGRQIVIYDLRDGGEVEIAEEV